MDIDYVVSERAMPRHVTHTQYYELFDPNKVCESSNE